MWFFYSFFLQLCLCLFEADPPLHWIGGVEAGVLIQLVPTFPIKLNQPINRNLDWLLVLFTQESWPRYDVGIATLDVHTYLKFGWVDLRITHEAAECGVWISLAFSQSLRNRKVVAFCFCVF